MTVHVDGACPERVSDTAASVDSWLVPALAGLAATLLGLGLARFAYTPLIPALVADGWVGGAAAGWLGTVNMAGYVLGAMLAARLPGRTEMVLTGTMAAAGLSLVLCAVRVPDPWLFPWLSVWRLVAGFTGAVLMVRAAPAALALVPAPLRARATGVVFAGIGLGIALSGTAVPVLVALSGPAAAWLVLGAVGLALSVLAGPVWRAAGSARPATGAGVAARRTPWLLVVAYGTDGAGFLPHTLFLSDFVARGLGQGIAAGGTCWALFGAGAVVGPPVCAWIGGRIGFARAFAAALLVKAVAVALPLFSVGSTALGMSAVIVGLLTPGLVALGAGLAAEFTGGGPAQVRLWGRMVTALALAQLAGAAGFSWLFGVTGQYLPLFAVGAVILGLGAACALVSPHVRDRRFQP